MPELPVRAKEQSLEGSGTVLCCPLGFSLAAENTVLYILRVGLGLAYKCLSLSGSRTESFRVLPSVTCWYLSGEAAGLVGSGC